MILALGLSGGALIALVSLFNALYWRELPVVRPKELVGVSAIDGRTPAAGSTGMPAGLFASLDKAQSVFQEFAGFQRFKLTAVIKDAGQQLEIVGVSGRYFDTLSVGATLGRVVGASDVDAASPVATISFRCWQTRFGADPKVVGQTFRLQGEIVTVVGVAAREFTGLEVGVPADAWVPASLPPRLVNWSRGLIFFEAFVGRLRPGVTLQQARIALETLWPSARQAAAEKVSAALAKARDDDTLSLQPQVESAALGFSGSGYRVFYRRSLALLMMFSAITIVLACANLSGLLLARWSTREGDLAVQAALGASRGRLVSQVVGESLGLSTVAVMLSAPLAVWSAKSLTLLLWNNPDATAPLDLNPDYRVIGLMVGLAGVVSVCVSLLPASRVWFAKLRLMPGARGLPGRSVTRWGRRLAAAQVALSVPLVAMAWIIAANLHRLERVNTGFQPDGVIVASLTKRGTSDAAADAVPHLTQLASALRANSGIAAAALTWNEPLSFGADWRRRLITARDGVGSARSFVLQVSPGYFETLSVPLMAGRDFLWTDDHGQRNVAIISAGLANVVLPGTNPLGQNIRLGGQPDRLFEVIGVVADANLAEPHAANQSFLFTALLQESPRQLALQSPIVLLKSPLPQRSVEGQARGTISALGRDDLVEVHALRRTRDAALLRERAMRLGALYFAGLTTLLVFIGLYAVLNLGVMRRMPEIGLRIALGASTYNIRMTVIREALLTATAGLAAGIPCAFVSGRLIVNSLTLVGPHDAVAFGVAIALILVVSVLSVLIPLRRASRVMPVEALGSR